MAKQRRARAVRVTLSAQTDAIIEESGSAIIFRGSSGTLRIAPGEMENLVREHQRFLGEIERASKQAVEPDHGG